MSSPALLRGRASVAADLRYNTSGNTEPMVNRGLFARQLNPQGTPLSCLAIPCSAVALP